MRQAKAKTHVMADISGPAVRTATVQAHMGSSDGPVNVRSWLKPGAHKNTYNALSAESFR